MDEYLVLSSTMLSRTTNLETTARGADMDSFGSDFNKYIHNSFL